NRAGRSAPKYWTGPQLRMTEVLHLVVVTGLSGSGKSTAIKVLEDLGFYCIDNLPVALIPRFVEVWESSSEEVRRVALGLDVRERHFLDEFPRIFEELRVRGVALEVLYLEASDDVLVRRFNETRRPHPAAQGGVLADGIRRESDKLRALRPVAGRPHGPLASFDGVCRHVVRRPRWAGPARAATLPPRTALPALTACPRGGAGVRVASGLETCSSDTGSRRRSWCTRWTVSSGRSTPW